MDHINIQQKMEKIKKQEEHLLFKRFTNENALEIGLYIVESAKKINKPVAINILKNGQTIFHYAMDGTAPDQDEWIKRKSNVVLRHHHSSYYMRLYNELKNRSYFEFYSVSPYEFALHGGAFPINVEGTGVIGVITVSGLAQEEDHELIIEALMKFLHNPSRQ
ncbi:heme-degrading domain-containing protein [Bacillus sp. BRMEA1]|uniref:heme-degrading domain-containing protein n=1 Tax=Neobacillus endophyticus TaxID=2738405 RepID=UPI00156390F6|nr:heme-degrading domain-containing protein [Neobacillus endophyticus]NRD79491.1 heme-degrading domain-containing protein [Neobacillus endophyticus]